MKNKYTNEITKAFDEYNGHHHYMLYDEQDILNRELPVNIDGYTVGSVVLTNNNKIFAVYVDTNLRIKYSDEFEKEVSDKFMDLSYDFSKDIKE